MRSWPRRRLVALAAVAFLTAIAIAYAAFVVAGGGSKPRLKLDAAGKLDARSGGAAALDGSWRVAGGSIVGYRVREKLSYLPAPHDAVGRTRDVTGTLSIRDRTLSSLDVAANLSTLQSDRAERDSVLLTEGPEFARYPDARFVLTAPLAIGAGPLTATGDLTLHRTTRHVAIPFQAAAHGDSLELAGAIRIRFSDYGFEAPKRPIVSIRPTGEIEFKLVFART